MQSITLRQIRDVISKYFLPIFSPSTAIGAVAVSSGKAEEVETGFRKMGFDVERKEVPMLGGDEAADDFESSEGSEGMDGSEADGEESGDEKEDDGMDGISSP